MKIACRVSMCLLFWMVFFSLPWVAELSISSTSLSEIKDGFLLQDVTSDQLAEQRPRERVRPGPAPNRPTGVILLLCRSEVVQQKSAELDDSSEVAEEEEDRIADPLEPVNRVFFHFNDKFYFWVLKPVATGYTHVFPEKLRMCFRNFFSNLLMPVRAVNCLLQGKIKGFGIEITRFVVNSTMGVAGFGDAGKIVLKLEQQNEDFGQTLGFYGLGPGIFIDWPILGASSLRDTVGSVGDAFLNPVNYLGIPIEYNASIKAFEAVNESSLTLGEYESFKKAAFDPYVSVRNAYHQNRQYMIKK